MLEALSPMLCNLASSVDSCINVHEQNWVDFRRDRHKDPEPSGEEVRTSQAIQQQLEKLGLKAVLPVRGVGVVADLCLGSGTLETPAIAIRADIDALRMPDKKSVDYSSCNEGAAHACGHDVHQTIALAVAEALTQLRNASDVPSCRFRFLFQAAEETCDGATWMIEDGYLENVESILGVHVEPNLLVGQVGIRYGGLTANVDELAITIRGKGGHTARPHNTTDPIHAAAILISDLYQILPRSIDVRDPSVLSFGRIQGGRAANVIPSEVELAGTLRSIDPESREMLRQKICSVSEHVGQMTGNTIDIEWLHPLGGVWNSDLETDAFQAAAVDVVGTDGVVTIDRPSMGGEDFAMYLENCTGSQIRLGCATSLPWPHLHSTVFDVDERVISVGARIVARAALQLAIQQQESNR